MVSDLTFRSLIHFEFSGYLCNYLFIKWYIFRQITIGKGLDKHIWKLIFACMKEIVKKEAVGIKEKYQVFFLS